MEYTESLRRLIYVAILTACVPHSTLAGAADISAVKIDEKTTAIVVIGDIEPADKARFRSMAQKYDDAIVLLESNGGSVGAAIDIGEAIRLKGYPTAVINGSSCNSSCALIWLAGTPRALSKSGRIGFHAAYAEVGGQAKESGVANAMVGRYLTLLNLPEQAVFFATTSPPSSLNWLTATNYKTTGIETTIIGDIQLDSDVSDAHAKYAVQNETDLWRSVQDWSVFVDHTLDDSCFLLANFNNNTVFRIGLNATSPGHYYLLIGNPAWRSLQEDKAYQLTFKFGSETPWDVPTTAIKMGDEVDLMAKFSDNAFWTEFVNSPILSVTKSGKAVTAIEMKGTRAAFDALIACQKAENANKGSRDPFAE